MRQRFARLRHRLGVCHRCWRRYVATATTTVRADGVVIDEVTVGVCPEHLDELFAEVETVGWDEMTATLDSGHRVTFPGPGARDHDDDGWDD